MRIVADHNRCEGLGMCEAMAPHIFEVGADGFVDVLEESPPEDERRDLAAAIDACPVMALSLKD